MCVISVSAAAEGWLLAGLPGERFPAAPGAEGTPRVQKGPPGCAPLPAGNGAGGGRVQLICRGEVRARVRNAGGAPARTREAGSKELGTSKSGLDRQGKAVCLSACMAWGVTSLPVWFL